jgi:outer membrane protein assembly factor BamB
MQIWRRRQVNDLGELDEVYVLAKKTGEQLVDNPNSAVVWKYDQFDRNGDSTIDFDEQMHRSLSSVVVHEELAFCVDHTGLVHCLDRRTGKLNWVCDLLAAVWGTPLLADGRLYVADEDGDVAIFQPSADAVKAGVKREVLKKGGVQFVPALEFNMEGSVYCTPVAANGVLYIASRDRLFAIAKKPQKP